MTEQDIIAKATRIMASTPPEDLIQALADAWLLADPQALQDLSDARGDLKQVMTERCEKAEAERDALAAQVRRVRGVHSQARYSILRPTCWECGVDFPCPTIRALDDPQEQP